MIGLVFALLWEGLVGQFLAGVRWVAVGPWGHSLAAAVSPHVDDRGTTGATYAVVAAAVVTVASVWFAGDRLRSFTLRGDE